jgi:hypothetical protein
MTLHCHPQYLPLPHRLHIQLRSRIVLPSIDKPLKRADDNDDGEGDNAIVHVAGRDGKFGGKDEEDGRYYNVDYSDLEARM